MFLAQNLNSSFAFHIKKHRTGYIKGTANIKHKTQKQFIFQYQTYNFIDTYS